MTIFVIIWIIGKEVEMTTDNKFFNLEQISHDFIEPSTIF